MAMTQEALELGLEVGDMSADVLRIVADALTDAAIKVNNAAMNLPEREWREAGERAASIAKLANAYAQCAVVADLHDDAFVDKH